MAYKVILPRKGSRPITKGEHVTIAGVLAMGAGGAPKLRVAFSPELVQRLGWASKSMLFLEHDAEGGRVRMRLAKGQEQGFHLFIPKKSSAPRIVFSIPDLPNQRRPAMLVPHEVTTGDTLVIKLPDWAIMPVRIFPKAVSS